LIKVKLVADDINVIDKVPVFIAEIAPKNLRGTLTALTQVNIAQDEVAETLCFRS
jgi:hypothetical protein